MDQIYRIDQKLVQIEKPALEMIKNFRLDEEDVLVVCAGFEERALAALNAIESSVAENAHVVIIEYRPEVLGNKIHDLKNICEEKKLPFEIISYDREVPDNFGSSLVTKLGEKGNIFIDVSAMSRILIVQIMVAMGQRNCGFKGVRVLYAEAEEYPPSLKEVDATISSVTVEFLSSGIFGICVLPELSSVAMQGMPTRLITFPSFSPRHLTALRNELQPSNISFIHGIPHLDKDRWRQARIKEINCIDDILNREEMEASTLNYKETMEIILKIYDERKFTDKILIAPTGSKMQALSVGIIRAYLDDIQIVYPTPRSFTDTERYTLGIRQLYILPLDSFTLGN